MKKLKSIKFYTLAYQVGSIFDGRKIYDCRIIKGTEGLSSKDIAGTVSMKVPAPSRGGSVCKMTFVRESQSFTKDLKGPWHSAPYVIGATYSVNGLRLCVEIDSVEPVQVKDLTDGEILSSGVLHTALGCYVPGIVPGDDDQSSVIDPNCGPCRLFRTPKEAMKAMFDNIYGDGAWDNNPWCWLYKFHRVGMG